MANGGLRINKKVRRRPGRKANLRKKAKRVIKIVLR